jgi:hypothetical protein
LGDNTEFEDVVPESVYDTDRWTISYSKVVKEIATGNFFDISWAVGATEYQDVELEPFIQQVYPIQVTKTEYTTEAQEE